jgi:hypothetical protein
MLGRLPSVEIQASFAPACGGSSKCETGMATGENSCGEAPAVMPR